MGEASLQAWGAPPPANDGSGTLTPAGRPPACPLRGLHPPLRRQPLASLPNPTPCRTEE